jgi:hypothetical protein
MPRTPIALLAIGCVLGAPTLALGGEPLGTVQENCGVPLGTGAVELQVTIILNGKPVTKTVTIAKGDIVAFVQPARLPGEKLADWIDRIAIARGEASQAKAKVVAEAINKAFGLKAPGVVVTTGIEVQKQKFYPTTASGFPFKDPVTANVTIGAFIIPNVSKNKTDVVKFTENKVIGEGGNGTKFLPGTGSSGERGALEQATPGVTTVATGVDPDGAPSEVEFGIDGKYVADFKPSAGMTDVVVLRDLARRLDHHGIPATFDAADGELFLDTPFPDGETLDWGSTDTGLEFATVLTPSGSAVPEPDLWALMLAGFGLLGAALRGRRGAEGSASSPKTALREM